MVHLTDAECTMLELLGAMRSLAARSNNVEDAKIGNQDGRTADIDGLKGEYAFCKKHNLFPDLAPIPRSGSYDCIYNGKRIDIKTTRYKTGKLLCTLKDNPDVDVYVLAILEGNSVEFKGWAYKEELCSEENIEDQGHGYGYALTQDKLRSW